jgi:hypothetical protein
MVKSRILQIAQQAVAQRSFGRKAGYALFRPPNSKLFAGDWHLRDLSNLGDTPFNEFALLANISSSCKFRLVNIGNIFFDP